MCVCVCVFMLVLRVIFLVFFSPVCKSWANAVENVFRERCLLSHRRLVCVSDYLFIIVIVLLRFLSFLLVLSHSIFCGNMS